ncbi:hypothetical protein CCR75_008982 [Bremia lactucae]|uniref:Uncharacterized protein n=1 Tax=Bremia lactucae TaxID=4779 RepID=A0A976IHI8_BRELC|nr:hypothetical protein CCR75_008982 [Bremia lactucae]
MSGKLKLTDMRKDTNRKKKAACNLKLSKHEAQKINLTVPLTKIKGLSEQAIFQLTLTPQHSLNQ